MQYDNFSHVGDSQSAAGMLLALFNAMNKWQGVLFLYVNSVGFLL